MTTKLFKATTTITLHNRKYKPGEAVSLEDLKAILPVAANIAIQDVKYLNYFEAVEEEIRNLENKENVLIRVKIISGRI